ncbi:hypothetical protein PUN28_003173 [Cardiocondyla obscurior]|uniref:Secreted protein n=1 Tax=Cardiocondyla obscurior TaxID=286306 RepID=A0AAW2GJK7_9HYME
MQKFIKATLQFIYYAHGFSFSLATCQSRCFCSSAILRVGGIGNKNDHFKKHRIVILSSAESARLQSKVFR